MALVHPAAVRVLLVEDDPADAALFQAVLRDTDTEGLIVSRVARLAEALEHVRGQDPPDAVLLDLSLPDSSGLATFQRLHDAAPDVPVIVLTGFGDETMALDAVKTGAQDFLSKDEVTGPLLARSLRYAIERAALQERIRAAATHDELTGLHNLRGFRALAQQQITAAARTGERVAVIFADLDSLKTVNDVHGHAEGSRMIRDAASILSVVTRAADIVGRVGGDEFCVLLTAAPAGTERRVIERLTSAIDAFNASRMRPYSLAVSLGTAGGHPSEGTTLDALVERADAAMYEAKRSRRAS